MNDDEDFFSSSTSAQEEADESSSSGEEIEAIPTRAPSQRSSRGRRMSTLVGKAAEADQDFWEQSAWAEDQDDLDYEHVERI